MKEVSVRRERELPGLPSSSPRTPGGSVVTDPSALSIKGLREDEACPSGGCAARTIDPMSSLTATTSTVVGYLNRISR